MKLFDKDLNQDVVYVAEIGVNHEGSVEAASEMIRLAADAGADAVKFQTYTPERYASASDPERLERVGTFALDAEAHHRLAGEAASIGVPMFSSALTEDVVPLLDELFPAIKIASGDLTFEPVIRAAARTGKPVILSTGAGALEEVDTAVGWIRDEIGDTPLAERLVVLQCVSAYPASIETANVAVVRELAERYRVPAGYSNHVIGTEACLAAIALGATMIEAHFTDRKTGRTFRDHELSLEPAEFAELVRQGNLVRQAIGDGQKRVQPDEAELRNAIRKGVVAARDLPDGTILTRDDLMFARPAHDIAAGDIDTLLGRSLSKPLTLGETVTKAAVE